MITKTQKPILGKQKMKKKESKHNTVDSHQHTGEESKRRKEQRTTTKQSDSN